MKGQGTGKICLLYWGFVTSRFFFIHFTINEAKKIVRYTLYRGLHYIEVVIISRFHLQSKQVKRTPQDSINELIIWKMNPLVVPVSFVKFKAHFCLRNEQWISNENFSVLGQIEIFE